MAGDTLDQAAGQQAGNRQAALDAIAQGGRAGRQAFQQGQRSMRSAQDAALRQGAADAYGVFSSGGRVEGATQRITNGGYQPYQQALSDLQGAFSTNASRMAGLNSDYFAQTAASAPAYRQLADEQIDEARRRWEEQRAAAEASANGGGGDLAKWEIEAGATGLGEQMAGQALTQGREVRRANRQSDDEHQALTAEVQTFQDHFGRPPTREEYERMRADVSERMYQDRARIEQRVYARDEGQQQVRQAQATPEWAWQRAAADAMGVDPALAAGLFQPPTPGEMVNAAQDARQYNYLTGAGAGMFESPQAARDFQAAQYGLETGGRGFDDPMPAQTAAAQLGLAPEDTTAILSHPAFAQALAGFSAGVDAGQPLETINAMVADELAAGEFGHDFPQMRALLTAMYGHLAG